MNHEDGSRRNAGFLIDEEKLSGQRSQSLEYDYKAFYF